MTKFVGGVGVWGAGRGAVGICWLLIASDKHNWLKEGEREREVGSRTQKSVHTYTFNSDRRCGSANGKVRLSRWKANGASREDYFRWWHSVLCVLKTVVSRQAGRKSSWVNSVPKRSNDLDWVNCCCCCTAVSPKCSLALSFPPRTQSDFQVRRRPRVREKVRERASISGQHRETRWPSLTHEGTLSLLKWLNLCLCCLVVVPATALTYFYSPFLQRAVQTNEFKLNSMAYCLWSDTKRATLADKERERERERYFAAQRNVKPN